MLTASMTTTVEPQLRWKPDWAKARQALVSWWEHKGPALALFAPRAEPIENIPLPDPSIDSTRRWLDLDLWRQVTLAAQARTFCGGAAFPHYDTNIGGPGSLGLFLGATGVPAATTLWYEPCIHDPETHPPLRFDPANWWWQHHVAMLEDALRENRGRYIVGIPDLIENIDTLAQLRDPQLLLADLVERPAWVEQKIGEINDAYFAAYDRLAEWLRDPWGGVTFAAFCLWAPGRVAKLQCDFSCMISPAMFQRFVVPALTAQCARLDYSVYHLDGTQALHHLPALLKIEALDAIEWTPEPGQPRGGSPHWHDLYRRIKAAGKSVQAVDVSAEDVLPLLDAVGPEGIYVLAYAKTERDAQRILEQAGW